MSDPIAKYLSAIGRRGGKSRSPAKLAAVRRNAAKGRAARLERLAIAAGDRLVKVQGLFFAAFAGNFAALVIAWLVKGLGL